jgi:hypothetical protein
LRKPLPNEKKFFEKAMILRLVLKKSCVIVQKKSETNLKSIADGTFRASIDDARSTFFGLIQQKPKKCNKQNLILNMPY